MTRTAPVPFRRSRLRAGALALAVLAVVAAGCSSTDEGSPPPTTMAVAGTAAPPEPAPGTTTTSTTEAPAAGRGVVPDALGGVSDVAGGDPQEATCITAEVGRGLQNPVAATQAGGRNQVVGAAVAICLPPAKLAAAMAAKVQAGALGTPVAGGAVECMKATLVGSAGDPAYAPFVGAVVSGDPRASRQAAAVFDAPCGTTFAAGG
jgi:hypothetical protein